MKMSKLKLISTVLILTSFFCVQSAPAKPLNERSKELTWQAWLLVDDQNQNKQQYDAEGLLKRRITPKSVFIAPTFSPGNLPPCADGYTSDSMGRCVKLIQLDEDAHLIYILERLKQEYGNFTGPDDADYYDDLDEERPTAGPFQFNIPLEEVGQGSEAPEANVAIVVAPTNGNFNLSNNDSAKINNVKRDQNDTDAPVIVTRIQINDEIETTTTPVETTTTEITTTTFETTTAEAETEATTMVEQAIFFKIPNNTKANDTELVAADSQVNEDFVEFPETHQNMQVQQDETQQLISQLLPHANIKTKFEQNTKDLYQDAPSNLFDRDTQQSTETAHQRIYNHRNRDKWLFPPTWRDSPPQKPLVLRFNNLPHRQASPFYQHHPRQEGVYREVPPEDLSYIFGFKRGSAHR